MLPITSTYCTDIYVWLVARSIFWEESVNPLDFVTTIAAVATALGVIMAVVQIRTAMQQSMTQFEDGLSREYRELARSIPIDSYLGKELSPEVLEAALPVFFQYFHLSNTQAHLRWRGRVSKQTWSLWALGIKSTMSLPAFRQAWKRLECAHQMRHLIFLKLMEDKDYFDPRGIQLPVR
jgi:hypothetical protein